MDDELSENANTTSTANHLSGVGGCLFRFGAVAVVVFNTGFALLATVTLAGIVFITRPNKVMHQLPPEAWLPLLIIMSPALLYGQYLSWKTIFAGEIPTGLAIAKKQPAIPWMFKPLVCLLWFWNFCIGCIIVISLSEPDPRIGPTVFGAVLVMVLSLLLTFPANLYLLLATKTVTDDELTLRKVWRNRIALDLILPAFAMLYYGLLR